MSTSRTALFCAASILALAGAAFAQPFDAATNTMTGTSEVPDPAGGRRKAKSVATWPGSDQRVVKIYMTADAPQPTVTLTYKRRK